MCTADACVCIYRHLSLNDLVIANYLLYDISPPPPPPFFPSAPDARGPNDQEISGTAVVVFQLEHVSCKMRSGPPGDDAEDIANPAYYSGVIPLRTVSLPPDNDPTLLPNIATPPYALRFARAGVTPWDGGWVQPEVVKQETNRWCTALSLLGVGVLCGAVGYFMGTRAVRVRA